MRKIIAITIVLVFLTSNTGFALAPWMASQDPLVKSEIRAVLDKSQVVMATSMNQSLLLLLYGSEAILHKSGKYLVSKEVYNNPLRLVRSIIHEDIEAMMQIMQNGKRGWGGISGNRYRYNGIKELIFGNEKVLQRYYDLCHKGKKPARLSDELILNDIIAKALEIMFMAENGFVVQEDYKKQDEQIKEARFYLTVQPILKNESNRRNFFNTGLFISPEDSKERRRLITAAIDNKFEFIQVANFVTGPVSPEVYVENLKRFRIYDEFTSIVKEEAVFMLNGEQKVKDSKRLTERLLDLIFRMLMATNDSFKNAKERYNLTFCVMENIGTKDDVFRSHRGETKIIFNESTREIKSANTYINMSLGSFVEQILTIFHELAEIEVIEILLKKYPKLTPRELKVLQESGYTDWLTLDKDQKYAFYHGDYCIEAQKNLHGSIGSCYLEEMKRHQRQIREIFGRIIGTCPDDLEIIFGEEQLMTRTDKKQFDFGDCEIEETMQGFNNEERNSFRNQCLLFADSVAKITKQQFRKIKITMVEEKGASLEIFGNKSQEGLEKIALPGRFLYSPEILRNVHLLVKEGFNVIDLSDPSKYYSRFFINKILTEEKALMFLNGAISFNSSRDFSKTRRSLLTLKIIPNSKVPEGRVEIYEPTFVMENEDGQKEAAIFHGGWVAPGIKEDNTGNDVLKELLEIYEANIFMEFPDRVRTLNEEDISSVLGGVKNKDPKFRMIALEVLTRLDKPKYLEIILGALEDPVAEIQYKAAIYMSEIRPSIGLAPFLMGEIVTTLSPFDENEMWKGFYCLKALDKIDSGISIPEEWIAILNAVEDERAKLNFVKIVILKWSEEDQKPAGNAFRKKYLPASGIQRTICDVIDHHNERKNGFLHAMFGRLNMGKRDKQTVVGDVLEWADTSQKSIQDNSKNSGEDVNIPEAIGCSLEEMRKKDWREIKAILEKRHKEEKVIKVRNVIARIYNMLLLEKATGLIKRGIKKDSDMSQCSVGEIEALIEDLKEEADSVENNMDTGRWSLNTGLMKEDPPRSRKEALYGMMGQEQADKIIKEFEKAERYKQMADLISVLLMRVNPFRGNFELTDNGSEKFKKLMKEKTINKSLPPGSPAEALRVSFGNFKFEEFSKESLYALRTSHKPSTVDIEVRMLKEIGILLPVKGKPKHYRINPAMSGSTREETEKNLEAIYNIKLKTSLKGKECPLDRYSIPEEKIPAVKERVKLEILHRNLETAVEKQTKDDYVIKMWSGYAVSREQKEILQKIRTHLSNKGYKIDFGNITDEKKSVKELVDFALTSDGNNDNTVIVLPFKEQYVQENLSKLKNAHVIFIDYDRRKISHERFFHIGGIIAASVAYLANNDLAFKNICNILTNNTADIDVTIEQLKKDPTLLTLLLDPVLIKDPNDLKNLNERMEKLLMSV